MGMQRSVAGAAAAAARRTPRREGSVGKTGKVLDAEGWDVRTKCGR